MGSVPLSGFGAGYGSSQDLDVRFFSPRPPLRDSKRERARKTVAARATAPTTAPSSNFRTPSPLEFAETPWSLESMAARYGDQVSARSTSDLLILRPPRATLALGRQRGATDGLAPSYEERITRLRTAPPSSNLGIDAWEWRSRSLDLRDREDRYEDERDSPPQRPPKPPSNPRDIDGVIDRLLALLPPEEGAPIFDPGKPPSRAYPVGVPPRHRFPSLLYESINPDYVFEAPLGLYARLHRDCTEITSEIASDRWTRGLTNALNAVRLPVCRGNLVGNQLAGRKSESLLSQVSSCDRDCTEIAPRLHRDCNEKKSPPSLVSQEVSTLPTSISGGVRQDVPLSPALVARLAVAGGLCSATTRAVTSPIDLIKTRRQAAIKTAKAPGGTPTGTPMQPSLNSTAQSEQHFGGVVPGVGDPLPPGTTSTAAATAPPPVPSSPFLGIEASIAAGFAAGAGSFGTYEFLKRTIPQLAGFVMGPAAPADLATPILFTACLLQAVAASVCSSPFETARVKIMTGSGAPDAPQNLAEALDLVMRGDAPAAGAATEGAGVATTSTKLSLTMPGERSRQRAAASGAAVVTSTSATASVVSSSAQRDSSSAQRDVLRLWDGLPTLMGRELPFGVRIYFPLVTPPFDPPLLIPPF